MPSRDDDEDLTPAALPPLPPSENLAILQLLANVVTLSDDHVRRLLRLSRLLRDRKEQVDGTMLIEIGESLLAYFDPAAAIAREILATGRRRLFGGT